MPGDAVIAYHFASRESAEIQGERAVAASPKEGPVAINPGRFYDSGTQLRIGTVSQTLREAGSTRRTSPSRSIED